MEHNWLLHYQNASANTTTSPEKCLAKKTPVVPQVSNSTELSPTERKMFKWHGYKSVDQEHEKKDGKAKNNFFKVAQGMTKKGYFWKFVLMKDGLSPWGYHLRKRIWLYALHCVVSFCFVLYSSLSSLCYKLYSCCFVFGHYILPSISKGTRNWITV